MGVWIETSLSSHHYEQDKVTPFVGVWVETASSGYIPWHEEVTPFVGVWIETPVAYGLETF